MEEDNKLPLKRVELSLTKFNEVAIPHHLNLLRQHKANIIKHESSGALRAMRVEQTRAGRVASQLRVLLNELADLRSQVRTSDLHKFDAATQRSRDLTLKAIVEYLDTPPLNISRSPSRKEEDGGVAYSAVSTDSVGVIREGDGEEEGREEGEEGKTIQLIVDEQELAVSERSLVLSGWQSLQREVSALHETWQAIHELATSQRHSVDTTSQLIDAAADNVTAGTRQLSAAEKLRVGAFGAGGAVLGALAGGPVGLVVGMKAGACAALAGGVIGFVGGRIAARGRREQLMLKDTPTTAETTDDAREKPKEQ